MLEHGDLEMGHARCLLMIEEGKQYQVAQLVVAKNLSVRETEALVARVKASAGVIPKIQEDITPFFEHALQTLSQRLQAKVKIKQGVAGKGTLIIHYDDMHSLQQMIGELIN